MACSWLRSSGDAGDLSPNLKGLGPGGSILEGWNLVTAKVEQVADPIVSGQEPLRLPEFQRPLAHGLMADDNAARSQQLIHHSQAEREAE